jgi:glycosyltransferase involved in cell wall biosynthesis
MKHIDIHSYNQSGNLLVITNYPPRGEGIHTAKIGGVSGCAKNTLVPLSKLYAKEGRKIIVLADVLTTPQIYEEDGMLIIRAWKRNAFSLYAQCILWCMRLFRVGHVLVEFEFASLGNFSVTSVFPAFLLMLRLAGRHVTIVLHQVVDDLWSLLGHIGLRFDSQKFKLFETLLPLYYVLLVRLANTTVVLEEEFKKRLSKLAPIHRISVVPHGIQAVTHIPSKKRARKLLGVRPDEFVVTSFGFITWYKGTDTLLSLLAKPGRVNNKDLRLIIAGGPSTTQKNKPHYQRFYEHIKKLARGKNHITITGFLHDRKIPLYMAASDVVVFPYRTAMSSSGPLATALAYNKQILVSKALMTLFHTSDYQGAMKMVQLQPHVLMMPDTAKALIKQLEGISKTSRKKRLKRFMHIMHEKRNFTTLASSYYTVCTPNAASIPLFRFLTAFR